MVSTAGGIQKFYETHSELMKTVSCFLMLTQKFNNYVLLNGKITGTFGME